MIVAARAATRSCATLAAARSCPLPPHKLVPMPCLSPTMTSGVIMRWRIAVGASLPEDGMEPLFDVLPVGLTDDPEDGDPILEIEAHEFGFLAKVLVGPGERCRPDEAIAVIVENAEDVPLFADAYAAGRPLVEPATFAWQAYLAAGQDTRACSNS
jgi:pyruvate/2-oxoglutarate dehydrogenase complex dihydrolipoamide acyltransferase (E2) component